jgi:hypothetical protein
VLALNAGVDQGSLLLKRRSGNRGGGDRFVLARSSSTRHDRVLGAAVLLIDNYHRGRGQPTPRGDP